RASAIVRLEIGAGACPSASWQAHCRKKSLPLHYSFRVMVRLVIPRKSTIPNIFPTPTFPVAFSRDDPAGAAKTRAEARVLIVEDDYLVAAEIENALDTAGFDVIGIANSADEALELAAAERPLLAVMDIRLNGR